MATSRFCVPSLLLSLALGAGGAAAFRASAADAPAKAAASGKAGDRAPDKGQDKGAEPADDLSQLPKAAATDLPVDMERFLAGVPENLAQDAVWRLAPNKILPKGSVGKSNRTVIVPVRVGKGAFRAGDPPVGLDNGRFIGWFIPVPDAKDADGAASLPPGAPRMASAFAVTADGRIHWTVDRFVNTMDFASGGVVTDEKTFYTFNLDRQKLKALAVPPYKKGPAFTPAPKAKTQSAEDYRAATAQAKAAHEAREDDARKAHELKKAQYAAAMDKVGTLPDKLSAPAPEVAYAVYYVPAPASAKQPTEWVVKGHAAGVWKPSPAVWAALVELGKANNVATPEARKAAEAQFRLVAAELEGAQPHPLALEAASVGLARPGMLDGPAADSPICAVCAKVLAGAETGARGRVMRALVAASDSTAKAGLLAHAVAASDGEGGDRKMSDKLRVSALRVMLRAKETDTDAKRVAAVLGAWSDPAGAPVDVVFTEFAALATDKDAAKFGGPMTFERAKAMAPLFKFQDIPDAKRRAGAMAAVAAAAGDDPLAGVLVDEAMLSGAVAPLEALAAVASAPAGKVPLYRATHGLLPRLEDKDDAVREAAWRAIAACQACSLPKVGTKEQTPAADLAAIVTRVAGAGVAGKSAPAGLADFLAGHMASPGTRGAAGIGMVQELGRGGEAAARQVMAVLAKSGTAFADALAAVDEEARWKAVAGCYEARKLPVPLSAGLLLSAKESEAAARWFAAEFIKGNLPMASQYADLAKDKVQLMDWVMAQEPRLARAAVAILTYQEGGNDAQAAEVTGIMLAQEYKLRAQMERKWEACRNDLFTARAKASEGEREVRLAVCRKGDKAWKEGATKQVALKWDGEALATGVPGVALRPDADKKVVVMADVALLDRLNPKMRHELDLGALAGPVEFTWAAPCWEARLHPDASTEVLVRVAPVGWGTLPALPEFK